MVLFSYEENKMRYLWLAIFVVLYYGSESLAKNDYMRPTDTPTILQKLDLERTENGYKTWGTFILMDGNEVTLPVTSEFYETVKIGTKVEVPVRGMDINPNWNDLIIKGFIPVLMMGVSLLFSVAFFFLSLSQAVTDIKLYHKNKEKRK